LKLAIDVETNTFASGNPYSRCGKLVSIHCYTEDGTALSFRPEQRSNAQALLDKASLLLLFNGKFDLAWLRKLGLVFPTKIYDVQLAHFFITNQLHTLPSLDDVAHYYNIPGKVDVVKTQYWDQGIDTENIPWDVLCTYGEQDVKLTYQLYELQQIYWANNPLKRKLFSLACQDQLVLLEMEWNGLKFDEEKCYEKSKLLQEHIGQLVSKLSAIYPTVPINFNSNDQLSAFLYGGVVQETYKELIGFYKTGAKSGQPKYRNAVKEHLLPRMFTPLPKSEMAKPGVYSTAEGTLRKLKGKHKHVVEMLLELAKLTKLDETYYQGLTKLRQEKDWPEGKLHGQFNQCIARTGRLSSSQP
jgi:DNA polymerase I-like protein with 3'-5' exonuclease and polymerase domains